MTRRTMSTTWARLVACALAPVLAVALALATAPLAAAATEAVAMTDHGGAFVFSPASITIHVGDEVTWSNATDTPHTVTSDGGGELASATMDAGATYSHTFGTAGTFAYHCTIHPNMTGSVTVLAAGAPLVPSGGPGATGAVAGVTSPPSAGTGGVAGSSSGPGPDRPSILPILEVLVAVALGVVAAVLLGVALERGEASSGGRRG